MVGGRTGLLSRYSDLLRTGWSGDRILVPWDSPCRLWQPKKWVPGFFQGYSSRMGMSCTSTSHSVLAWECHGVTFTFTFTFTIRVAKMQAAFSFEMFILYQITWCDILENIFFSTCNSNAYVVTISTADDTSPLTLLTFILCINALSLNKVWVLKSQELLRLN